MDVNPISVLLIEGSHDDAEVIQAALCEAGPDFRVQHADHLSAGLEILAQGGVDIVLLDTTLPDSEGFPTFLKVLDAANGLPIIILSGIDDAGAALETVRKGAQDYLIKGRMSGQSLGRCIRHAVERHRYFAGLLESQRKERGRVVLLAGVRGGVGVSTLALNIAAAMAQSNIRAVAVEFQPFSNFALHLRKPPTAGLSDLLEMESGLIDRAAVDEKLISLPFGARALFAGRGQDCLRGLNAENGAAVLNAAALDADVVIAELPPRISGEYREVFRTADFVAIVLEPEPLCIELAKSTFGMLESFGLMGSPFGLIVVNRGLLANAVKLADIRTRTGHEIVASIPPAAEACVLAIEAGTPLVALRPEARFSAVVTDLARNLSRSTVEMLRL